MIQAPSPVATMVAAPLAEPSEPRAVMKSSREPGETAGIGNPHDREAQRRRNKDKNNKGFVHGRSPCGARCTVSGDPGREYARGLVVISVPPPV